MKQSLILSLIPKKDKARSLLKTSFRDPMFSLVPYEIWRDLIVCNVDPHSLAMLSQTCRAFKEIFNVFGENDINIAKMFRKEEQFVSALKYLHRCAENNNSIAMFHLGYAYYQAGWGLCYDEVRAMEWFRKAAERGNGPGMAFYALCLRNTRPDYASIDNWVLKAVSTGDPFACGFCHYSALGLRFDNNKAFTFFEASALSGDEYGQYMLGLCFHKGYGIAKNTKEAVYWYKKSGEQGLCVSQHWVGIMHRDGHGCEKNEKLAISWFKKAAKQGNTYSCSCLKSLGCEDKYRTYNDGD